MSVHFYEPKKGHGLPHDPMNAIVGPRVIGWIGTRSQQGVLNLAPYSFFNLFNYRPPILGFSSIGYKDSVRNAIETGEFSWNLATQTLATAMNQSSTTQSVDEFEFAGLTPAPSKLIQAPRVAETPVSFECKVTQHLQLEDQSGTEIPTWFVFGEVVAVYIDHSCLDNGIYQTSRAQPILRAGGPGGYFSIHPEHAFEMRRPQD
ncbi:MAG TPA: flavin reductase family protein [Paenalcaligenes sp.]|nr:flavin reductase family protein [Paenalcaligenes sp.]